MSLQLPLKDLSGGKCSSFTDNTFKPIFTMMQREESQIKEIPMKNEQLQNKLIINSNYNLMNIITIDFLTIKRKKYSMFSSEVKKKCIEASHNNDLKTVSKMFSVPLKSLKRWIKVGPDRKKGGGRKIRDPEMESNLYNWYVQQKKGNTPVTPKMIKQKALSLTKFKDFIASKGWLEKFKRKFNLQLSRDNKSDFFSTSSSQNSHISTVVIKN